MMDKEVLHKFSYGLYIVASTCNGKINGFIATTAFQVTAKPAQIAIASNINNFTTSCISTSKVFSVNILRQNISKQLINTFGFQSGCNTNKFDGIKHSLGITGCPIEIEESIGYVECKVVAEVDLGTHILFTGEVISGEVISNEDVALTYQFYKEVYKGQSPEKAPTYLPYATQSFENKPIERDLYRCSVCNYVYDSDDGDPDRGVPQGTLFEDVNPEWRCPICFADKSYFIKQ